MDIKKQPEPETHDINGKDTRAPRCTTMCGRCLTLTQRGSTSHWCKFSQDNDLPNARSMPTSPFHDLCRPAIDRDYRRMYELKIDLSATAK